MAHWRKTLDLEIHEVVYEDLVSAPEAEARKLMAFLGLEWQFRLIVDLAP